MAILKFNIMSNSNRREFMKKSVVLAAAPAALISNEMKADKKNNQFVHHVFFYLKNNNAINRDKLIEGLRKLTKISHLKAYNIGIPADTDRDVIVRDYSISWLTYFKDAAAEAKYQVDPIHLKFVEEYKDLWDTVKVYDSVPVIFKM